MQRIYVAPGNGGTAQGLEKVENITDITENDFEGLVKLSKKLKVNLVVPGPDVPIVKGIEGHFRSGKIALFAIRNMRIQTNCHSPKLASAASLPHRQPLS